MRSRLVTSSTPTGSTDSRMVARRARRSGCSSRTPTTTPSFSSDGLERGKPDPACFLIAARRLGVDATRCVVLEDAPAGIRAGRAAGATVIALRTTHRDDDLREAAAIVDSLATLLPVRSTTTRV
jgi:sugar-phosphatase